LDEDALAERSGAREEDVVAGVPLRLLEQDVLAQPRLDLERLVADQPSDLITKKGV